MKADDGKLNELLKSARVPERSEGYWEAFPRRVTVQLSEGARTEATISASSLRLWAIGLVTAGAALVLCVSLWMRGRPVSAEPNYTKLYHEIESMFPNQVRGIVVENGAVKLDLSEKPDVPSSLPLRVDVCRSQQCRTYITFSGQQIRVNAEDCDVLTDGAGHVLVVGQNIVWSSAEPARHNRTYQIGAEPLGASS